MYLDKKISIHLRFTFKSNPIINIKCTETEIKEKKKERVKINYNKNSVLQEDNYYKIFKELFHQ